MVRIGLISLSIDGGVEGGEGIGVGFRLWVIFVVREGGGGFCF